MEVSLQIDRAARSVHGTLAGEMIYGHVHEIISALVAQRLFEYRRLYDARSIQPHITFYDIQMVKLRLEAIARTMAIGPAAVVVLHQDTFALLGVAERLMASVFDLHPCRSIQEAEDWLGSHDTFHSASSRAA